MYHEYFLDVNLKKQTKDLKKLKPSAGLSTFQFQKYFFTYQLAIYNSVMSQTAVTLLKPILSSIDMIRSIEYVL